MCAADVRSINNIPEKGIKRGALVFALVGIGLLLPSSKAGISYSLE